MVLNDPLHRPGYTVSYFLLVQNSTFTPAPTPHTPNARGALPISTCTLLSMFYYHCCSLILLILFSAYPHLNPLSPSQLPRPNLSLRSLLSACPFTCSVCGDYPRLILSSVTLNTGSPCPTQVSTSSQRLAQRCISDPAVLTR